LEYRRLGNSGLKVSQLGLGSWLTYGGMVEDQTAEACIDKAYELGINFFDTANIYRRGGAEVVVGRALSKYPRESFVLATKAYWPMAEGPNDRGLSRKHIFEQVHASLKRLNVDYIDLWQCHRFDTETPLEETLRAIDDLITQGKILYAGVSEWTAVQISDALHIADVKNLDRIISNQPQYSMLERYIEKDILPLCEREGVGQVVWSPLAQGVLTGKYKKGQPIPENSRANDPSAINMMKNFLSDENLDKVAQLEKVADEKGCTLPALALSWVLRQPNVASAIIGASNPKQIEENVKALDVTFTKEELDKIDGILQA
jgi:voltage-dependent potassium channel beta subunit